MNPRTLHRRQLLAVAAAAPWVVPASALGLGRPAPSNRIALAFIGLGWKGLRGCFGSLMTHFMDNPVSQPRVLCDVNRKCCDEARAVVERRYGAGAAVTIADFREAIARPDVDAVVIATPDHWHAIQTIWACRHGKDVYCEKPLSLTVREARAMVDAARRYGRIVQTGNQSRSNVNLIGAMELLRSGRIGRIKEIHAACGGPSVPCNLPGQPVPPHIDWEMWLGPAPWRPYHEQIAHMGFRAFRDYSGGGMTDWGAHHFDLGQWAMGLDHTGPVEILPPGKDRPWLTFRYANGAEMLHNSPPSDGGVHFVGTEGRPLARPGTPRAVDALIRTRDRCSTRHRKDATAGHRALLVGGALEAPNSSSPLPLRQSEAHDCAIRSGDRLSGEREIVEQSRGLNLQKTGKEPPHAVLPPPSAPPSGILSCRI